MINQAAKRGELAVDRFQAVLNMQSFLQHPLSIQINKGTNNQVPKSSCRRYFNNTGIQIAIFYLSAGY